MNKNKGSYISLGCSLVLHGVFFALLLVSFPPIERDTESEIIVDLVSAPKGERKKVGFAPDSANNAKHGIHTTQEVAQPIVEVADLQLNQSEHRESDAPMGESEIGSDVDGRLPQTPKERYLVNIRDRVRNKQKYPRQSYKFREEGSVKVRMTIDRIGTLTKVELLEPSPHFRLNDAAMKAVSEAAPFSSFPSELSFQHWKITVPIRFQLSGN